MNDPSPVGRTDEAPDHPGLTIKIYKVNPQTLERGPATHVTVLAAKGPMESSAFPLCECPRCRTRREQAR